MAKSIRSKAKRKLRAIKRQKVAAKQKLKLLAAEELGSNEMAVDKSQEVENTCDHVENLGLSEGAGKNEESMTADVTMVSQSTVGSKTGKNSNKKKVKRLNKKKKRKYKW